MSEREREGTQGMGTVSLKVRKEGREGGGGGGVYII